MADLGPVAWPPEPIRTERLLLRAPEARDRAAFIELLASPEVGTYLGGPRPRDELEREMPETPERPPGLFAVDLNGVTIGQVILKRATWHAAGKAELGYLFLPEAWGFGYAAEACAAALGWLDDTLPGEPVVLKTQTANARSMRLAAKLGFTEVERFEAWGAEQWLGMRSPAIPDNRSHVNTGAEITLSLDDGEIYVRQDGPRDAPALLLIHGNASSSRWWDELVPMLTRSHRVIRIDLLGYGRSAKPADRSYALPDQARRVGVTMDRLGVERVVVVGHSSGGAAATALAEVRPDLVAALVLINTGPHLGAYIAPPTAIDLSQWPDVSDEQLRQLMSAAFSRPGYQIPVELLNEVRAMTFHSLTTTTTQASRDYVKEQALPDRLASIGKPLLVIFGEEDRRWRSSSAADYRAVPGARVEMLPGLGHTPILEDPARTASCLLAFTAAQMGPG